jgi:hypothetical protein
VTYGAVTAVAFYVYCGTAGYDPMQPSGLLLAFRWDRLPAAFRVKVTRCVHQGTTYTYLDDDDDGDDDDDYNNNNNNNITRRIIRKEIQFET